MSKKDEDKKKNAPEKNPNGGVPLALKVVIFIITILLTVSVLYTFVGLEPFLQDAAIVNAEAKIIDMGYKVETFFAKHYDNLYEVGKKLEGAEDEETVREIVSSYIGVDYFGNLRYFNKSKVYTADGIEIEVASDEDYLPLIEASKSQTKSCTKIFRDKTYNEICVAFYIPVKGSQVIDGIGSIIRRSEVADLSNIIENEYSFIAVVESTSGKVMTSTYKTNNFSLGTNFFEAMESRVADASRYGKLYQAITSKSVSNTEVEFKEGPYVVSSFVLAISDNTYTLVGVAPRSLLVTQEYSFIVEMLVISIIAIFFLMICIVLILKMNKARQAQTELVLTHYVEIGCPNGKKFFDEAEKILNSNRTKDYCAIYFEVAQFQFISDKLGGDRTNELLKHIGVLAKNLATNTGYYGYDQQGRFYVLREFGGEKSLRSAVQVFTMLANKTNAIEGTDITVSIGTGVCSTVAAGRVHISALMENAKIAFRTIKKLGDIAFYSANTDKKLKHDADIEARMEKALADGEFVPFFQPKYNYHTDKVHSAEALVRWYNPEKNIYTFPFEFIELFEKNGFIKKLDHNVYIQVCEFIRASLDKGDPVVPISVNVSRVTAIENDFLDFYVRNKKKYAIPNDLICIEFTESFAIENYDIIENLVEELHKNGIKCSLDDFGSGYSSFNILKNVPMDELKMDILFLKEGVDKKRDEVLARTVVELAKRFNMLVVQEGVETAVQFDYVKSLGVDVIQGYYFAKPISADEFNLFIKSNTSIKIKGGQ